MRPPLLCLVVPLAALSCLVFGSENAAKAPDLRSLPTPKRIVVPKLSGPVSIDGDLREPVWQRAAVAQTFTLNDGKGPERESTTVRIWYDDNGLHLGWTCVDADIQATFTARDSKFWEEEVVEFFVTTQDLSRYFELQWNPLGGVFDAIIANELEPSGVSRQFTGDWNYTAKGMRSAVKVKGTIGDSTDQDASWQVEVFVPFSDLNVPSPKPGEVWRANFYRFNRGRDHPVEPLAWSPTLLRGFHQPSRFGFLEFGR